MLGKKHERLSGLPHIYRPLTLKSLLVAVTVPPFTAGTRHAHHQTNSNPLLQFAAGRVDPASDVSLVETTQFSLASKNQPPNTASPLVCGRHRRVAPPEDAASGAA